MLLHSVVPLTLADDVRGATVVALIVVAVGVVLLVVVVCVLVLFVLLVALEFW